MTSGPGAVTISGAGDTGTSGCPSGASVTDVISTVAGIVIEDTTVIGVADGVGAVEMMVTSETVAGMETVLRTTTGGSERVFSVVTGTITGVVTAIVVVETNDIVLVRVMGITVFVVPTEIVFEVTGQVVVVMVVKIVVKMVVSTGLVMTDALSVSVFVTGTVIIVGIVIVEVRVTGTVLVVLPFVITALVTSIWSAHHVSQSVG